MVSVRYFALLRDRAGKDRESLETSCTTLGELYEELRDRYGFPLGVSDVKASLNGEWAGLEASFSDGDEIVFIPPVAGG